MLEPLLLVRPLDLRLVELLLLRVLLLLMGEVPLLIDIRGLLSGLRLDG